MAQLNFMCIPGGPCLVLDLPETDKVAPSDTVLNTVGTMDIPAIANVRDNDTLEGVTGGLSSDSIISSAGGNWDNEDIDNTVIQAGHGFGIGQVGRLAFGGGVSVPRLKTSGGEQMNVFGGGFTTAEHLYFDESITHVQTEVAFTVLEDAALQIDSTPALASGLYRVVLTGTGFDTVYCGYVEYDDKIYSAAEEIARNKFNTGTTVADLASGKSVKLLGVDNNGTSDKVLSLTEEQTRNTPDKTKYKLAEVFKKLNVDTIGEYSGGGGLIPSAPTGLVLTAFSLTEQILSWDFTGEAYGFDIYRASSELGVYTKIYSNVQALIKLIESLSAGQLYFYKVKAKNYNGDESPFSSIVSGNTFATYGVEQRAWRAYKSMLQADVELNAYVTTWKFDKKAQIFTSNHYPLLHTFITTLDTETFQAMPKNKSTVLNVELHGKIKGSPAEIDNEILRFDEMIKNAIENDLQLAGEANIQIVGDSRIESISDQIVETVMGLRIETIRFTAGNR